MVSGNRFEGDLSLIDAAMQMAAGISDDLRGAAEEYQDGIADSKNWPGFTDEYARETRPGTERSQEQFTEASLAGADAFDGITGALEAAKHKITGASDWANDEIAQGKAATDNFNFGARGRR
jgi:hypothetical protein